MIRHEGTPQRYAVRKKLLLSLLLLCFSLPLAAQEKTTESDRDVMPGKVRVKIALSAFQEKLTPEFFGALSRRYGIGSVTPWLNRDLLRYIERKSGSYKLNGGIGEGPAGRAFETPAHSLMRIVVVEYSAAASPQEVARALASVAGVEYAEPIGRHSLLYTPNDPRVKNGDQWHLETIRAMEAWDIVRGDSTIVIAITDTGIERDHSDLKNAIWHNPGESGNGRETNGIDDDGNGLKDDWWGYDFAGNDGYSPENDPSPGLNDHGVHVAGIAGATGDNDIFGAGVAYGVRLMAVKISDDKDTPELPAGFDGMLYAAAMGADVINCSWGAKKYSNAEQDVVNVVVRELGVPVVAAAGNDGEERLRYPAGYDNVLSVAATRQNDARWSGGNFHYNVDISAPGESIYSTLDGSNFGRNTGTSMASPVVAAAAALVRKQDPSLTPDQVYEILRASADNIDLAVGLQYSGLMGSGRLNLARAVQNMSSLPSARMVSYMIEEETPDGIVEPGEGLTVRATVHNLLAPATAVGVVISPVQPVSLPIEGAAVDLGPMAGGESAVTPAESFRFVVPEGTPPDSRIVLKVTATATAGSNMYSTNEYVILTVYPTYATTQINRIAATFNSVGNVGYNGMNRDQGDGFYVGPEGSLIWHGGLMIGTAQNRLIDVVRRGPSVDGTNDGFMMVNPYRLERDQEGQVETGRTTFTDRYDVLGVDVEMVSYEFAQDSNFVIAAYKVTNRSGAPIEGLHCGLYLDWDLQNDGKGDQASYDEANRLGFVRNRDNTDLFVGTALLSGQTPLYYAVDNLTVGVSTNFTQEMKWNMLSNGITKQNTPPDTDVSMVIGGGPVTIADGASETFVFGLMGARTFAELQETTAQAQDRHMKISNVPYRPDFMQARMEATPNPFSDRTELLLTMPATDDVRLEITDLRGNPVGLLHQGRLEAGEHRFTFDADDLPSGVYFYRLKGKSVRSEGRMVLVR